MMLPNKTKYYYDVFADKMLTVDPYQLRYYDSYNTKIQAKIGCLEIYIKEQEETLERLKGMVTNNISETKRLKNMLSSIIENHPEELL